MRRGGRCLLWILGVALLIVVLGLAIIYSGLYNVSAMYPDRAGVDWLLSTTMDKSVVRHAAAVKAPSLDDPKMVEEGFRHYREMCVMCHGSPGSEEVPEFGRGLNPAPPPLVEEAEEWSPEELFWITKNGIRMTGMAAWGETHTDDMIWDMVAFMRRLPKLSEAEYAVMDKRLPLLEEE